MKVSALQGKAALVSGTYHILHNELGSDALDFFYAVRGRAGAAGVVLTGHEQLVILLVGCRRDQGEA